MVCLANEPTTNDFNIGASDVFSILFIIIVRLLDKVGGIQEGNPNPNPNPNPKPNPKTLNLTL